MFPTLKACFAAAVSILIAVSIAALILKKVKVPKAKILKPRNIWMCGAFVATVVLIFPIFYSPEVGYSAGFSDESGTFAGLLKALLFSVFHAMESFTTGGDLGLINNALKGADAEEGIKALYSCVSVVIFFVWPFLTFAFVLSFFKGVTTRVKLFFSLRNRFFVFSELNEKSLSLAKSASRDKNVLSVFADASKSASGLADGADAIGAVCLKKAVTSLRFSKRKNVTFFVMGENDGENSEKALSLINQYSNRENTSIYAFISSVASEMVLSSVDKGKIKLCVVNEALSLVYRTLYEAHSNEYIPEKGGKDDVNVNLFKGARLMPDGKRGISAVVVGMDKYGTEMIKALVWFCQMEGYRVTVDAFDPDGMAESRFKALCPELMSEKYNGVYVEGEAQYHIVIHSGSAPDSLEFAESIKALSDTTYVFVSLGNDNANIETAADIRRIYARKELYPRIDAVVCDGNKKQSIGKAKVFGENCGINCVGDRDRVYSVDVIINSELEKEAKKIHLRWNASKEDDFFNNTYYYRSSMASALHEHARISCSIPGAGKADSEMTAEERRWQ